MKKTILWLLVLCMVLSISAVACNKAEETGDKTDNGDVTDNGDNTDNGNTGEEETLFKDKVKIKMATYNYADNSITIPKESETELLLEDIFNVDLEIYQINIHLSDPNNLDLLIATGEIPDVFYSKFDQFKYIDDGVVRPIKEEWLTTYMPVWLEAVEANMLADPMPYMYHNGEIYFIPNIQVRDSEMPGTYISAVRQDWLDRLGLDIPTTIEEYHEMLYAFTYNDPDGNGEKDTYGTHIGQMMWPIFEYGSYGVMHRAVLPDANGDIYMSDTSEGMKEVVKELNRWFEEGIMITKADMSWTDAFYGSKIGCIYGAVGWSFVPDVAFNASNYATKLYENNPDAVLSPMAPFAGPDGLRGNFGYPALNPGPAASTPMFGKNASDEVVIRFMQMQEALMTDEDLLKRVYFGIKGQDYDVREDGTIQSYLTAEGIVNRGLGEHFAMIPRNIETFNKWVYPQSAIDEINVLKSVYEECDVYYYGPTFFSLEQSVQWNSQGKTLRTYLLNGQIDFITGAKDIDAEWENYVKEFLEMGGQAVLDECQTLYDKYNK